MAHLKLLLPVGVQYLTGPFAEPPTRSEKIIEALRPGGWLVLEEPDFSVARVVTGPKGLGRSVQRVNEAIQHMFSKAGLDPAFGVKLPCLLQELGLVNLAVENHTPLVQGGSPMATIMKLSAYQLAERYLATGRLTKTDLTRSVLPKIQIPGPCTTPR